MKKIILLLLGVLMAFPTFALEFEYTYEGHTLKYSTDGMPEGEVSVTSNPEINGNLIIPDYVWYNDMSYSVTSISESAFYGCISLTSVTIPNIVTEINALTFYGCISLTSVTIPNSVTKIGLAAFSGCCSLTSITIPNSVTYIDGLAFIGCSSLTSVAIPNSVNYIGNEAFNSCSSLTSVTIPNSVNYIGVGSFALCYNLVEISIAQDNINYESIDGVVFNKDITIIIACPGGKQGEYNIPTSVTSIGAEAFYGCRSLTSVTIPNSVTEIGEAAFFYCSSLTSVTIPNSVTSIVSGTFYGCSSLTSVNIPNSVTSIGDGTSGGTGTGTFGSCSSLASVTIPNSVISIGYRTFSGCSSLTSVYYSAENPICGDYSIFAEINNSIYKNATLYVPAAAVEKCKQIDPWKNFRNIQAYDFSNGVEDAVADFDANAPYEVYSLKGVKAGDKLDGLAPGVYILRQGRAVKKVTVK